MAALTVSDMHIVKIGENLTKPAGVAITVGQIIREDTTTGRWALVQTTTAPLTGTQHYVAIKTVAIGEALTGFGTGSVIDIGEAVSALAFDAIVYASDVAGGWADTAGTVSTRIGTVTSGWASGNNVDRLVKLD